MLYSTLTMALYNLGAEHEHLYELHEAQSNYEMALKYSEKYNITNMTPVITKAFNKIKDRLSGLDETLTRRSVLREEKSAHNYFNDP